MSKPSNLRIEDVAATTARADLNDILISIASLQTTDGDGSAYTGEPTTTYPNMLWYDKSTSILKVRTTADDAWINVAYVDQSGNAYRILDNTQVVNTSGTQTGLLGDQSTATWQTGTGTTESLVSPAKVKSAVEALAPSPVLARCAFNGTSSGTISVEANGVNVSNVTKNGTGDYTINFTNSLSNANYAVCGTSATRNSDSNDVISLHSSSARTTSSVRVINENRAGGESDSSLITIVVLG